MGTEFVGPFVKQDNIKIPSIRPGFESRVPFTRIRPDGNQLNKYSSSATASQTQKSCLETEYECNNDSKTAKSLRHTPWESRSDDDVESEQFGSNWLPKGVIRGCESCDNCQKVTAKWRPDEARRPDLEDAPVFYPSEEEFQDTLKYISSIRSKAEKYGICRIVPPPSWNPPCPLKEKSKWQSCKLSTRVQRIDKLQNRESMRRKVLQDNDGKRRKKRICLKKETDQEPSEAEEFGFESGPEFSFDAFQKYDDDFKVQYFRKNYSSNKSMAEPSVEEIEGEYWRMVEQPTEEIEVLYGADLETGAFGSGFPKKRDEDASEMKYIASGWNLNNLPRLPGSVLSFESSDISGVLVPWLYIGMCFSSFCWHVEDHHLYSLNYMHWGSPKLWYGVPGSDALHLEAAMRKHLPDLFEEQPDLLHKLVTQLSPSILKSEGVPVYRCVQNPGEFVLTFPRAYHAGFNCGFNCAEAVNVAPVDWLPHGQNAIELYREQGRQTSISHDKLLLGAAREAVKANWEYNFMKKYTPSNSTWNEVCGKDGVLSKTLKNRVEVERVRREFICKSSKAIKMESSFDADSERECSVCLFDLHLSAAGCRNCSPNKYACLNHAKQLCTCLWGSKYFLFRYDISELSMLVDALEGKLSAVYRWARLDMGFSLTTQVSKDHLQTEKEIDSSSNAVRSETKKTQSYGSTLKESKHIDSSRASQSAEPLPVILALEAVRTPSKTRSPFKKEKPLPPAGRYKMPTSQETSALESSVSENKDVIVLSDDEEDESVKEPFAAKRNNSMNDSNEDVPINNETQNAECSSKRQQIDDQKSKSEDGRKKLESKNDNLDRYYRAKGPRIAKVVRRMKYNVEALEFGAVCEGKLWCDNRAIYPKGFRSRVSYIDVDDPTNTCYYVNEILDVGRDGPLFMVYVENNPNEVFGHVSASRCWEMVRERVNQSITKQRKLGKTKLPPLQPPGSLDAIEMFGFSSPPILQVIEIMDKNHVCTEYWKSRHNPRKPESVESSSSSNSHVTCSFILDDLFKKANAEELHTVSALLTNINSTQDQRLLNRRLSEEINKQPR
ncbi:hypothetical protein ACP275_06G152700 [Erythranthe tilingii]